MIRDDEKPVSMLNYRIRGRNFPVTRGKGRWLVICDFVIFFIKWIVPVCRMIIFVRFLRQKKCREERVKGEKVLILFPRSVYL